MKSYVLNKMENKIEVYETIYCPKKITSIGKDAFYSDCTLLFYKGSLPLQWKVFNRCHNQVEGCSNGNQSHLPYYGYRNINGVDFKLITRSEVVAMLKKSYQTISNF